MSVITIIDVDRKGDQKEGKEKKKREKKVVAKEMAQDDEGGEEWQEVTGKGGAPIVTVSHRLGRCICCHSKSPAREGRLLLQ